MTRFLPGLIVLALLGLLILQWKDWPPPSSPGELAANPAAGNGAPPPDPLAALQPPAERDSYATIVERPLFRPDRKPEPPPDAIPETADDAGTRVELEQLDLTGVMIAPSAISAWVRDPGQPKLLRLRIGDEIQGWAVRDVLDDRILLERQGEEYALILRDYSKAPPMAPPMPIPRRPPKAPERTEPPVSDR